MKIEEILGEAMSDSEFAEKEFFDDLALAELEKIEKNAESYFQKKGNELKVISTDLQKMSDAEFGTLAGHPAIVANIRDNHDHADDAGNTSSISLEALVKAMGK